MKSSSLNASVAIQQKLFEVDTIVNEFENKNSSAIDKWLNWLKESEELLKKYNYSECAKLAGLRSTIIKEYNVFETSRVSKRKRIFYKAIDTINPAQSVLSERFTKLEDNIQAVRSLIRQILIPAKEAGIIQYDSSKDFTVYIESLLHQFKKHEQLAPGINSAIASIGKYDVLRILAEEIEFE